MARKKMTEDEERQAIADAVQARDDDTIPAPVELKPGDGSVVLSVRLPIEKARALRAIAADRKQSLSAVLVDAVQAAISMGGPQIAVGDQATRFRVSGATFDFGETWSTPAGTAQAMQRLPLEPAGVTA